MSHFAINIAYETLYASGYYGHAPGTTSFDEAMPGKCLGLFRALGCTSAVDVGGGNGLFARALREQGFPALTFDFRADAEGKVLPFSLNQYSADQLSQARGEIARVLGAGAAPVVTCFDCLEHIDREHLWAALSNLNQLAERYLFVSVSTRPSSRYNLFHASVLPLSTWRTLFAAAGLEVVSDLELPMLSRKMSFPDQDPVWGVNHWRSRDPFRDSGQAEPTYLCLRKLRAVEPGEVRRALLRPLLLEEVEARRSLSPAKAADLQVTLLVGSHRELDGLRPLLEVLQRDRVEVLLLPASLGGFEERSLKSVTAFFACRGVPVRTLGALDGADLRPARPGAALVTADEHGNLHVAHGGTSRRLAAAASPPPRRGEAVSMAGLVGEWAGRHTRTVLVDLSSDTAREGALRELGEVAQAAPETLWVGLVPPTEPPAELPANVLVFDAILSLFSGVTSRHLVEACDLLLTASPAQAGLAAARGTEVRALRADRPLSDLLRPSGATALGFPWPGPLERLSQALGDEGLAEHPGVSLLSSLEPEVVAGLRTERAQLVADIEQLRAELAVTQRRLEQAQSGPLSRAAAGLRRVVDRSERARALVARARGIVRR